MMITLNHFWFHDRLRTEDKSTIYLYAYMYLFIIILAIIIISFNNVYI